MTNESQRVNVAAFASTFAAHVGATVIETCDDWRAVILHQSERLFLRRDWKDTHHLTASMTLDPERAKWWTGCPKAMPSARFDARRGLDEIKRDLTRRVIEPSRPILQEWRDLCDRCERQHQDVLDMAEQFRTDGATVRLEISRFDTVGRMFITGPHGTICATASNGTLTVDRLSLPLDLARKVVAAFID